MDFDELDWKQQVDDVISVDDVTGVTIIVVTPWCYHYNGNTNGVITVTPVTL